MTHFDCIIVGGGAAGFFTAINLAKARPDFSVAILERSKEVLSKVKISGGGRCNVTHAEFVPKDLVTHYPRGEKELLGPFHTFMTGDTIAWFEEHGVTLKIEDDGRMFPVSDSSQTIIDCFLNAVNALGIQVLKQHGVEDLSKIDDVWNIHTKQGDLTCDIVMVATGSSPKMWNVLERLGYNIIAPVPSLFTFNITDDRITDIPGVVVPNVTVDVLDSKLSSQGPLLITHWGLSAPSILKLSAWGALELAARDYKFAIKINFINQDFESCILQLKSIKQELSKKAVINTQQFAIPKRLWKTLVIASQINNSLRWADVTKIQLEALAHQLTAAVFQVNGKSTFKEEFVTAGGVALKQINFKTYESKLHNKLYFAGEVLNIDAITGGFNFQNAWTGAYISAQAMSNT